MANNSKKEALQDPPERIYNSQTGIEYIRGKYLGEVSCHPVVTAEHHIACHMFSKLGLGQDD